MSIKEDVGLNDFTGRMIFDLKDIVADRVPIKGIVSPVDRSEPAIKVKMNTVSG
jgi:hypothetical protein